MNVVMFTLHAVSLGEATVCSVYLLFIPTNAHTHTHNNNNIY